MARTSRASKFAGVPAQLVAPSPDAELVSVCAAIEHVNAEYCALSERPTDPAVSDAIGRNADQWEELTLRAAAIPATTLEGVRARVRALGPVIPPAIVEAAETTGVAERAMLDALVRDLTASMQSVGLVSASPDAQLLAACAEFGRLHREVRRLEILPDLPDEDFCPVHAGLHEAAIEVAGLHAVTVAGVRAKAEVRRLLLAMDEPTAKTGRFNVDARRHDVAVWSTLADLLAGLADERGEGDH